MKKLINIILVVFVVVLSGWYFGVSAGMLWGLFVAFAVYDWDSRIVGVMALASLSSCPVLLYLERDDLAETMAVYAFFFLVITVTLQIIELKHYPERFPEENEYDEK